MKTLRNPLRSLFGPSRNWHYSFGTEHVIDFCFYALECDGPRPPPFDRHPAGDGKLQAAGLDSAGWWQWFAQVVAATGDPHWNQFDQRRNRWPPPIQPAALWEGAPEVGQRLAMLGEAFEDMWDARETYKMAFHHIIRECDRPLWNALAPYRKTLPPVRVVTVGYPGPVHVAMSPATVVLAVGGWEPTPSELAAAILSGMRDLAATSPSGTTF